MNRLLLESSDGRPAAKVVCFFFRSAMLALLGLIFSVTARAQTETVLHSFGDGSVPNDGEVANAGLILGSDGNFYGTTQNGGTVNDGTFFQMTPQGAVTILYSFGSVPNDGTYAGNNLVQGSDGNFYGTTDFGGSAGHGIIFKMTPQGAETILHNFGDGSVANDGTGFSATLVQGADGNFYGTTLYGGSTTTSSNVGDGTV
ncbi:MAG TPA: choice-of-anchor tandem repeat GloVer-containing protein, partial [Candidatus Methylacidiphilales bacterium]|nr:choice-of-anchor tandem repeat GloVer-containing protein [Candidatus Methylacidiphilales bacterium]